MQGPSGSFFAAPQQVCEILHILLKRSRAGPLPEYFDNMQRVCEMLNNQKRYQLIISYFHMFCQYEYLCNTMYCIFINILI